MPETAVDKYGYLQSDKHDVYCDALYLAMQAESKAQSVK